MENQIADLDDPDIWSTALSSTASPTTTRLWSGLCELERELRCLICGHFMRAPVSVSPCQHSFCSECIRRHWMRKHVGSGVASQRTCAYCNGNVTAATGSSSSSLVHKNTNNNNPDSCLVPNRYVEIIIMHFQAIREPLFRALKTFAEDYGDPEEDKSEEKLDQNIWSTKTKSRYRHPLFKGLFKLENAMRCLICTHFMHEPVSAFPCQHSFCSQCIQAKKRGRCTYCYEYFGTCLTPNRSVENIIAHFQKIRTTLFHVLNSTDLEDEDDGSDDEETESRRKEQPVQRLNKMGSTYYKGKSKKQLQELCAQQGLSTQGSEKQLQKRHSDFVLLYNSECDSFRPRTKYQLANIIHQREKERAKEQHLSVFNGDYHACMQRIYRERKRLGEAGHKVKWNTILSGNIQFDDELAEGFRKLKRELEEREQERKKNKKLKNSDAGEQEEKDYQTLKNESKDSTNQLDVSSSEHTTSELGTIKDETCAKNSECDRNVLESPATNNTVSFSSPQPGAENSSKDIVNPYDSKRKSLSNQDEFRSPTKKTKSPISSDNTSTNHLLDSRTSSSLSEAKNASFTSSQPAVHHHSNTPETINPYADNRRHSLSSQAQLSTSQTRPMPRLSSNLSASFSENSNGKLPMEIDAKAASAANNASSPQPSVHGSNTPVTMNPYADRKRHSLSSEGQLSTSQTKPMSPLPSNPSASFSANSNGNYLMETGSKVILASSNASFASPQLVVLGSNTPGTINPYVDNRRHSLSNQGQLHRSHTRPPLSGESFRASYANSGATAEDAILVD